MMQKLSDNLSYYTTGHLGFVIEPIETQEKITNQQIKQINQSMISLFEVSSEAKSKYEVPAKQSIIEQSQEYAEEEEEEIIDRLDHNDDDDFQQGD
jgi:transcriptional regulatory protein LevR